MMMMKTLMQFFLAALIFFTISCKKSNAGPSTPATIVDPPVAVIVDNLYQPITKGSYWTFSTTTNDKTVAPTTTTITGDTTIVNGKIYHTGLSAGGTLSGNTNYYHANDTYSFRTTTLLAGITIEYVYLKDDIDIGKTWTAPVTDDGMISGLPAQILGKIVEKGITKTVSGKTFTNVIHTQLGLQYNTGTGFATYQTMDYYIAKDVGIIETDSNNPAFNTTTKSIITDYFVK